jgi:hypothetical protein
MDNLKKNLHFVVLGVGLLLGIVFMVVGIIYRGGVEEELVAKQAELARALPAVQSEGTLADVKARSERFSGTLTEATEALSASSLGSFGQGYDNHSTGGQFYCNEANRKIRELKARFDVLQKPIKFTGLLERYTLTRSSASATNVWEEFEKNMANPQVEQIRDLQRMLRFLDELATACERLVEAGHDDGMGVRLTNVKTDGGWVGNAGAEFESPWMNMKFDINLECSAGFALLLAEELARPTSLTMAKMDGRANRLGFPVFVDLLQLELMERPAIAKFEVSNEGGNSGATKASAAAKVNEHLEGGAKVAVPSNPDDLNPETGEGKKLLDAVTNRIENDERIVLPTKVFIRVRAAAFNRAWRAVAVEE